MQIMDAGDGAADGGAVEEHVTILRRRIALHRRYLREGVDAALAAEYLREIALAEAELAHIEKPGDQRE